MPGSERDSVTRLDATGMAATGVDVQISAHSDLEKRIEELDSLPRVGRVINTRAGQKSRRGVLRRGDVHRRGPAGVDQADEIRAAALSLNRVGRVRLPAVEPNVRQ